jgi:hypothetical protein
MKKTVIVGFLLSSSLYSGSLSSEEITSMVAKIKKERVGISIIKLETTVNPFVLILPKKEENLTEEVTPIFKKIVLAPVYKLEAILNNAAFINKKWYKRDEKLGLYTIGHISKTSVMLKNSHGNKILSLKKKKFIKLH